MLAVATLNSAILPVRLSVARTWSWQLSPLRVRTSASPDMMRKKALPVAETRHANASSDSFHCPIPSSAGGCLILCEKRVPA